MSDPILTIPYGGFQRGALHSGRLSPGDEVWRAGDVNPPIKRAAGRSGPLYLLATRWPLEYNRDHTFDEDAAETWRMEQANKQTQPVEAQLGLFDAVCIIVGIVIGSTIYKSPQLIMNNVVSPTWGLAAWGLGGLLSFIGALVY